ncbi:MAG: C25 family cysteine peptidase, partial [Candidatus Cloacimonadota bacterium]|nr:C25 family cysteine peptidase [Candidatus Cloacimonadota bacterium]
MNKKLIFVLLVISIGLLSANNTIQLDGNQSKIELTENRSEKLTINYEMDSMQTFDVNTEKGVYSNLSIEGFTYSNRIGDPKLPISRKIISVPLEAEVEASLIAYSKEIIDLDVWGISQVIPAQESVSKSAKPEDIKFEINNKAYSTDSFNSTPVISVEELGILRGVRLFAVNFAPIQYNPVTNKVVVYNSVEVEIDFVGSNFIATQELQNRTFSPYFEKIYAKSIFNYSKNTRDELTTYPVKYVIVSDRMFEDTLQPFIEWKKQKGFDVVVGYTDDIGGSTSSIQTYIEDLYNAGTETDPAPSYVLFVGDVQQIPAFNGQTQNGHVTDLHYCEFSGDWMPEIYYGRFSATNVGDLQNQIDKTLMYERYEMSDPSYLAEVTMIAGADASWAPTHGNGQINYGTEHYFNATNGITSHTYLYPASASSSTSIIQDVSNGVGYVNYTAHGYYQEWSNPHFGISDINGLQNSEKYTFAVGNCCLTNHFDTGECFGEAWLRAEDKGAIAYIGGTNSTLWDEDYWWGVGNGNANGSAESYEETGIGVYDGLFHSHGEDFDTWFTSAAQMIIAGNLAVVEGNSSSANYYWEIYSVMGDPSISAYLGVPNENNASYETTTLIGMNSFEITDATPYSLCAISDSNDDLVATAITDETGGASLNISSLITPQDLSLVITAQNTQPVFETIELIPNEGAYVVVENFVVADENGVADFGETVSLDIDFSNVGSENATNLTASIYADDDEYFTIIENTIDIIDIDSESIINVENAFAIELSNRIPNNYPLSLNLEVTDDADNVWNSLIDFTAAAPKLEISLDEIDDSSGNNNGLLDPGETVQLLVSIANTGNSIAENVTTYLNITDENITITEDTFENGMLVYDNQTTATFEVILSENIEIGSNVQFGFFTEFTYYSSQLSLVIPVGLVQEDFESQTFDNFGWSFGGNADWLIDTTNSNSGNASAVSGNISYNQTSEMILTVDVFVAGEMSFYRKVSSEANYDYLKFYIDGQMQDQWAGNQDWAQQTYNISAGEIEFKWVYEKDGSVSSGSDCGWIDDIIFPGFGAVDGAVAWIDNSEIDFGSVPSGQTLTKTLTITNFGNEILTGNISTLDGFTIMNVGEGRDEFSINPNSNIIYEINFAPTEEMDYSGNIEITTID